MQTFTLSQLTVECERSQRPWLEFLRAASLSVGIYRLNVGQEDLQKPHTEDEVYYVVSGRGRFQAGAERGAVEPGSVLFVPRSVPHRFDEITEDLILLVFFAPPEGSQASAG